MAFKLNKKTDSDLKKLAKLIPAAYTEISLYREVLGAHLLSAGILTLHGKAVEPNDKYTYPLKFKQPVNHYKKLKNAYLNNGDKGVSDYAYGVRDFIEETAMPKSFGGIMTVNR